ncbi:hypothetical protein BD626DRAFT_576101 [Schizophyllum amplum]|uniref:Ferric oxidoreductase domain-containing protein n=1 Tax=Schizophyllum amplum TaxID=97359 RepID=A0A550BU79_9AGAR|nr:hypothetical protein BD626DRAFT_576101 [Auriculariopsis ampla]
MRIAPEIVWHLNIVLLCLLGLLALTRLPRVAARLTVPSEWLTGHLIWYKAGAAREQEKQELGEKQSATTLSQSQTLSSLRAEEGAEHAAPHVPAYPRVLRPLLAPLHWRWNKATRSASSFSASFGYEKLNFLHRHLGRFIVLAVNCHVVGFRASTPLTANAAHADNATIQSSSSSGGRLLRGHRGARIRMGLVATVCMDFLFIFSTSYVRNNYYNLFFWSHTICLIILIPAIYMHKAPLVNYVIAHRVHLRL